MSCAGPGLRARHYCEGEERIEDEDGHKPDRTPRGRTRGGRGTRVPARIGRSPPTSRSWEQGPEGDLIEIGVLDQRIAHGFSNEFLDGGLVREPNMLQAGRRLLRVEGTIRCLHLHESYAGVWDCCSGRHRTCNPATC